MNRVILRSRANELYFFFLRHRNEIVTWVAAIILYYLSFRFEAATERRMIYSIFITTMSLIFTIYFNSRQKELYYIPMTYRSKTDRWFGVGKYFFDPVNYCYVIGDANPGYIYSETLLWSDYEVSLDFKIENKCIGLILRATNLSDYAMLQISPDGINPHLQINGGWTSFDAKSSNLEFANALSIDRWYKAKVACYKSALTIVITSFAGETLLSRNWNLISGSAVFNFGSEKEPVNVPFSANYEFGSVGFRNWNDERASVRNLLIKRL